MPPGEYTASVSWVGSPILTLTETVPWPTEEAMTTFAIVACPPPPPPVPPAPPAPQPASVKPVLAATGVGDQGLGGLGLLLTALGTVAVTAEIPLERLWHAVPAFPTVSEVWLHLLEAYGL